MNLTILKWAYVYGALTVDDFDSLEEAIIAADAASDAGTESLQSIEIVGDRVYSADEVWALAEPIRQRECDERGSSEPPRLLIRMQGPDGKWATEWWSNDPVEHDKRLRFLRDALGADRVTEERR